MSSRTKEYEFTREDAHNLASKHHILDVKGLLNALRISALALYMRRNIERQFGTGVRQNLTTLGKRAEALVEILDNIGHEEYRRLYEIGNDGFFPNMQALKSCVKYLGFAADMALKDDFELGAKKSTGGLREFIIIMGIFYEDLTDKELGALYSPGKLRGRPPTGDFFNLVLDCFRKLGARVGEDSILKLMDDIQWSERKAEYRACLPESVDT